MVDDIKIAFIGSGAMGGAMIRGIVTRQVTKAHQIMASDPLPSQTQAFADELGVRTTTDNRVAVADADVVVLSVKPQILPKAAPQIRGRIPAHALVLSIIAGVPIATLSQAVDHTRIVRAMPNTPGQIGLGISVWTNTPDVTEGQQGQAAAILGALGQEIHVADESYLDMATGLSGSGPGFVFLFLEAMIDAGVQIGFSRADAQKLVLQTVAGSVALAQETGAHPATLKNQVTSPAGTTAAGLFQLEAGGVRAAIIRAVEAAYQRSQELGRK